jgi:protein gp37
VSPTAIEWTEETWNPTTGCDRISEGCDHCYIERTIPFRREGRRFDEKGRMGVRLHPERLDKPLHWRKPRRVFVNSLSDLFHADVPDWFVIRVLRVMEEADRHTFQILTKRPQRMAALLSRLHDEWDENDAGWFPAPNVWLGTSIESNKYAWRARHLYETPAAVRFLSLEPLLGPLPSLDLMGIDWVIVGGESGPGARPMDPEWARDIRDRCDEVGIPFFFKQWGGRTPKAGGRELDGRTWDEMPLPASRETSECANG